MKNSVPHLVQSAAEMTDAILRIALNPFGFSYSPQGLCLCVQVTDEPTSVALQRFEILPRKGGHHE